jgi:hypothetical protein
MVRDVGRSAATPFVTLVGAVGRPMTAQYRKKLGTAVVKKIETNIIRQPGKLYYVSKSGKVEASQMRVGGGRGKSKKNKK